MANNTVAWGFLGLQQLFATRVAEAGVERIWTAIAESSQEYTRVANGLLRVLAARTTVAQEHVELPGAGTLQPLDDEGDGSPKLTQPSGSYTVGYPIFGGGDAWGTNRVSRALMTVEEANRFTMEAFRKDADWLIRHALAALFDNVAYTYNDKAARGGYKGLGAITVQPLANSDTVVYGRRGGVAPAVDTHYLAQAGAIADATNPFPTIRRELMEHPSNSGPIVSYVPANVTDNIAGLTEFVEVDDPEIAYGAASDTLPNAPADVLGPGTEVLGRCKSSNIWIVEWDGLPDNYLVNIALGAEPPLAMREYPAAELQGFFPESVNIDGNHWAARMIRYAGFGVRNRVSACIQRVGNGAYAIPTGYNAPLDA